MSILEKKLDVSVKDYEYYESTGLFNPEQLDEIKTGFNSGIPNEWIELFAKIEYTAGQMKQIRWGIACGFSLEQILLYNNPEFDEHQMDRIRSSIMLGIPMDTIRMYAKPDVCWENMLICEWVATGKAPKKLWKKS